MNQPPGKSTVTGQTISADDAKLQDRGAFLSSSIAFRTAIAKHKMPGRAARLLQVVIRYSLERGEFKALIPSRECFCLLCGLHKADVSRTVQWLSEDARVLLVENWNCGRGGRTWELYSLRTPQEWTLPLRVEPSAKLKDLEGWLSRISIDQPELLEPPPSLADLLIENFIERSAPPAGARVESPVPDAATASPAWDSSCSPQRGDFESKVAPGHHPDVESEVPSRGEKVGKTPTISSAQVGETPTIHSVHQCPVGKTPTFLAPSGTPGHGEVGKTPTIHSVHSPAMYTRARSIDRSNRIDKDRFIDRLGGYPSSTEDPFRSHVSDRLFRLVGEHERHGKMGEVWLAAIDRCPQRLEELLSTVEAMQRERTLRTSAVRWLNTAVRRELAL